MCTYRQGYHQADVGRVVLRCGSKNVRDHDQLHVTHSTVFEEFSLNFQLSFVEGVACSRNFFLQFGLQFTHFFFSQEVLELDETIRRNGRRISTGPLVRAGGQRHRQVSERL